ncbi:MAG: hypothetical protein Q9157_005474 [Trypethelium eluteriae]
MYHRVATAEGAVGQCSDMDEPSQSKTNPSSLRFKKKIPQEKFRLVYEKFFSRITLRGFTDGKGWRLGILAGFWTSLVVLLGNLIILLLGAVQNGGYVEGIGILNFGEHNKMATISTAYHILINILSTALLTSSNFCMQILCSPTREEVDYANGKDKWVYIGILSPSNLRYISKKRQTMWWLLALSSLPLHLIYNSSIFEVTLGQEYDVTIANGSDTNTINQLASGNMKNLTNSEWTQLYDTQYVPNGGDLILVADYFWFDATVQQDIGAASGNWMPSPPQIGDGPISNLNVISIGQMNGTVQGVSQPIQASVEFLFNADGTFAINLTQAQYRLLADLTVRPDRNNNETAVSYNFNIPTTTHISPANASSIFNIVRFINRETSTSWWLESPAVTISYGLSQQINDGSQIQISRTFILVVIGCNIVKVVVIYLTLRLTSRTSFRPLITVGDAVASYLEHSDQRTAGACLHDKEWLSTLAIAFPNSHSDVNAQEGLIWGSGSQRHLSFAKSSFNTAGVLFNAWLANAPQLLLSMSYMVTNSLCTSMSVALEWDRYASQRKGLRVTDPVGKQRGTYFLQLPYRRAVPLVVTSGLLHWLLSQTLFLVRLDIRDRAGNVITSESKSTCGYSLLSLVIFIAVFLSLQLVVLTFMLWRIKPRMPVAACCSLIISAACHPPDSELDPHLQPVQWGVVPAAFGTIGHCTFSSEPVMPVRSGCEYA